MADNYPKEFYEGTDNQSAGFITPYKLGSGVMRGTQIIQNNDGSKITLGNLPGNSTQYGIAFVDNNGNTIKTDTGATQTIYDGNNIPLILIGLLPDGSYGMAIAKPGLSVLTAFS